MASRGMESLVTHGALEFYCGLVFFIVDSINAVLYFVTDGETSTDDFCGNKERAANVIGTVYSTLPIKDGSIPIHDIIQALGKNVVTPFTSHSRISLTSKCSFTFCK